MYRIIRKSKDYIFVSRILVAVIVSSHPFKPTKIQYIIFFILYYFYVLLVLTGLLLKNQLHPNTVFVLVGISNNEALEKLGIK
jgi:hypothetical protein